MKIVLLQYRVPFVRRFQAAWGTASIRRGAIAVAEPVDGQRACGEIAPLPGFSPKSLDEAMAGAGELIAALEADRCPDAFAEMGIWFRRIARPLSPPPSTLFGLSTMLCDLAAGRAGQPLSRWISGRSLGAVPVNGILGGGKAAQDDQIAPLVESGFQTVKLKVGLLSPGDDLLRIEQVLDRLPGDCVLRLDANGSWDFQQALHVLSRVDRSRIELVEEPLRADCQDQLEQLHSATGIDFALDETVLDLPRWSALLDCGGVRAVVLKPTLLGDIWRVLEIGAQAIAAGKRIIITTTFETGVATAACLHLAATFGDDLLPCGLDTLRFLERTLIEERLTCLGGAMALPSGSGLGVALDPAVLQTGIDPSARFPADMSDAVEEDSAE